MTRGVTARHANRLPVVLPQGKIMAAALAVKSLENLRPGPVRREVPDGLLPGLYFVIQPSGKSSWACRYRADGRPRKLTLGAYPAINLKKARELAREAIGKVAEGIDPGTERKAAKAAAAIPANDLIEVALKRYLAQHVRRNLRTSSADEIERLLEKEFAGPWRGRRLTQIARADIHAVLDSIVERGSPVQANRALAAFRAMCRWAVERGLIEANPCAGIRAPSAETARDRILSDEELKTVWQAADGQEQPYAEFVKLLILTGQRRSEVAEMRWSEIDLDSRLWTLPKERAKNHRQHEIPLSDSAAALLRGLPRIGDSDFIFTLSGRRPICGYHLVKQRLDDLLPPDMPAWVFHDLRRTAASGMARLGINLPVIEKLLNHVSGSFAGIVGVYQRHSYDAEKRAAMQTWSRHVEAIVTGEAAANVVELRR
jgi:integrase